MCSWGGGGWCWWGEVEFPERRGINHSAEMLMRKTREWKAAVESWQIHLSWLMLASPSNSTSTPQTIPNLLVHGKEEEEEIKIMLYDGQRVLTPALPASQEARSADAPFYSCLPYLHFFVFFIVFLPLLCRITHRLFLNFSNMSDTRCFIYGQVTWSGQKFGVYC